MQRFFPSAGGGGLKVRETTVSEYALCPGSSIIVCVCGGGGDLLIQGQSQGQSDELGDRVLGCRRVQDQAHLPAPGTHKSPPSAALTKQADLCRHHITGQTTKNCDRTSVWSCLFLQ